MHHTDLFDTGDRRFCQPRVGRLSTPKNAMNRSYTRELLLQSPTGRLRDIKPEAFPDNVNNIIITQHSLLSPRSPLPTQQQARFSHNLTMHAKLASGLAALSLASLAQARPSPSKALDERANIVNDLWCGPVLKKAATKVQAIWTIPTVSLPDPDADSIPDLELYQWIGLDGVNGKGEKCGDALLQAGTSQVWNTTTNSFTYDIWYEFYTEENPWSWHENNPPVKAGDSVRVTVTADSDGKGGTVLIENLTDRTSASYYPKAVGKHQLCYNHVEWVQEAPTKLLPNFPDFKFTSLAAWDAKGNKFGATGSDLWYLNADAAQCSSRLSSDGKTVYFTNSS